MKIILLLQVPLGILFKNENKGEDMVDIVTHVHQYVPFIEYTAVHTFEDNSQSIPIVRAVMYPIVFGDQLTTARIRAAQKHRCNADTPVKRLLGVRAMSEDWHTKLTVMEVTHNNVTVLTS